MWERYAKVVNKAFPSRLGPLDWDLWALPLVSSVTRPHIVHHHFHPPYPPHSLSQNKAFLTPPTSTPLHTHHWVPLTHLHTWTLPGMCFNKNGDLAKMCFLAVMAIFMKDSRLWSFILIEHPQLKFKHNICLKTRIILLNNHLFDVFLSLATGQTTGVTASVTLHRNITPRQVHHLHITQSYKPAFSQTFFHIILHYNTLTNNNTNSNKSRSHSILRNTLPS